MTNLIIQDNFLPYPNIIRFWALRQDFLSAEEVATRYQRPNTWPGLRSANINELDSDFANIVLGKISLLARQNFGVSNQIEIRSCFQLTRETDGTSWIHKDDDVQVAGLIYLTPDAPVNTGTTFYRGFDNTEVDVIGNVYNRLIMYNANILHKASRYFGENIENGRLTLVFFITGN